MQTLPSPEREPASQETSTDAASQTSIDPQTKPSAARRRDGFYLVCLGCALFLMLSIGMVSASSTPMIDFKVLYYPARCLVQHHDPYRESEVLRVYQAEAGHSPLDSPKVLQIISRYLYLPSAFFITGLFALLPWAPAHLIWLTLTISSLIFASFLIWDLGADYAPLVSGLLVAFFLINSGNVVALSNAAGVVTALCAAAIWCFARNRWTMAGAVCLAAALALKPQDAGLIWLYLLLSGANNRKHALRTLIAVLAIGLPGLLWVSHVAPGWMQEWHSNVLAFSARGGLNDPGPASTGRYGFGMMVSLPILFSSFKDDPGFYNTASILVTSIAFLALLFCALRYRLQRYKPWLEIAAMAAMSMLPAYHRQQDTKLLILCIPACAVLWIEGGPIAKWLGLVVTVAWLVLTGDILWLLLDVVFKSSLSMNERAFPVPLVLLATSIFYVCVHAGYSLRTRRMKTAP